MKPFLAFFGRRRRERELDDEIAAHLAMAIADRVARGETERDAQIAARRELGNEALVKETTRAQWGWGSLERFGQDVRYGLRLLKRSPGFTAVAVLTLALGVGANTAILSVVNAILLRPLDYASPDRLVVLLHRGRNPVAPGNYLDWKARSRSFASMGAAENWSANLTSGDVPEKLPAMRMTADILPMLGARPRLGRAFLPADDAAGRDHVILITDGLWKRRFAADPDVVGKAVTLNGESYAVLGVMPPGFQFAPFWHTDAEVWAPLDLRARASNREGSSLRVFGRLKDGVSLEAARQEIAAVTAALEREYPGTNRDVRVTGLQEMVVGDVRPALLVLLGAVGLVLLIACANVANMLLARSSARRREIALRAAIGASRGRMVRQILTESLVLAAAGGAAGVALGAWALELLLAFAPASIPRLSDVRLDARILLATFAVALATGVAFGLAPALQASSVGLHEALKDGGSSGASREGGRLRRVFVAAEFAIALVLLVGAGLMVRSFVALRRIDPGFDPRGVVSMEVSVAGTRQAEPGRRKVLYPEILERFAAIPGVKAAGAINHVPIAGDIWGFPYTVEGRPRPAPGQSPVAAYRAVLPGYFATMRLPILRGRDVAATDTAGAPGVVLVNDFLARRIWPGEDALGKRIAVDGPDDAPVWLTVIGVVKNAVQNDWSAPPDDEIYLALLQREQLTDSSGPQAAYVTYVVRTDGDPAALVPALRAAVWRIDRTLPISQVLTMPDVVAQANARARFQTLLLAVFAGVAALLAAVGIYGVMSYVVSRRAREIGLRMALGAHPRDVVRLVVGQGMAMALAGAAAGLAAAFLARRLMSGVLYGVGPSDPLTYGVVAALLLAIGLAASYLPARRAARLDPMAALRAD
ncbi:MAG TPA: ABC transporter permease [Thermoanaerobaculia bacterium]|jgi:predicted permease|nr:ABC transporter permease [Thermoanaerobaculia bacterium]